MKVSGTIYDPARFRALEWDQYWLSETPKVIGSTSWGQPAPRIVTWARFADRQGAEFVVLNTHLDYLSEQGRRNSATMIRRQAAAFDVPVIATGDFNTGAGTPVHQILSAYGILVDTWATARRRLTKEWDTYTGYKEPVENGTLRIDWIFASPEV